MKAMLVYNMKEVPRLVLIFETQAEREMFANDPILESVRIGHRDDELADIAYSISVDNADEAFDIVPNVEPESESESNRELRGHPDSYGKPDEYLDGILAKSSSKKDS